MNLVRLGIKTKSLLTSPHTIGLVQKMQAKQMVPDMGYLLHTRLTQLFQKDGPQPFWFDEQTAGTSEYTSVLGYTDKSAVELRTDAQLYADPLAWSDVDWEKFAAKPMPSEFRAGQRFGFSVRFCPVRQAHIHGERMRRHDDAFLVEIGRFKGSGHPYVNRFDVYKEWFIERLTDRDGVRAAKLLGATMKRFRLMTSFRQGQPDAGLNRKPLSAVLPDVTFEGVLEVDDPAGFGKLLRIGLGRQRPFGFGMVLLRKA